MKVLGMIEASDSILTLTQTICFSVIFVCSSDAASTSKFVKAATSLHNMESDGLLKREAETQSHPLKIQQHMPSDSNIICGQRSFILKCKYSETRKNCNLVLGYLKLTEKLFSIDGGKPRFCTMPKLFRPQSRFRRLQRENASGERSSHVCPSRVLCVTDEAARGGGYELVGEINTGEGLNLHTKAVAVQDSQHIPQLRWY